MESSAGSHTRGESGYNYDHFDVSSQGLDRLDGVKTGEPAPDFAATRLDGRQVRLSDYRGQVMVLETGSATCPMYEGRIGPMNKLAQRFPDIAFLMLYTREAHPGEAFGPHRSMEDKMRSARLVAGTDGEARTILVDDLAGSAHQHYGSMPNSVHVLDENGTVVLRGMWNDPDTVERALTSLRQGDRPQGLVSRFRLPAPAIMFRILRRGGWQAIGDFVRAVPKIVRAHRRPSRDDSR